MQDLKIYIVIENPKTKQDVSIRGNFEILRAFLVGVGTIETQNWEPQTLQNYKKIQNLSPERSSI